MKSSIVLQEVSNLREKHSRGDLNDDGYRSKLREKTKQLFLSKDREVS